jgi:aldose 1-epimerase
MTMRLLPWALLAAPALAGAHPIATSSWGTLSGGRVAHLYTLTNSHGMRVTFSNWGATITAVDVPDRAGKRANVALGFATAREDEAKNGNNHFGATIGRWANRIGGARVTIDGHEYRMTPNNDGNLLHSGTNGWDERPWSVKPFDHGTTSGAVLTLVSADGDQGFPGRLTVTMTFTLDDHNAFRIDYRAVTTKPTVINLTNHSYFNLAGAGNGTVENQRVTVFADRVAEADAHNLPTGRLLPVSGALDLRREKRIGDGFADPRVAAFHGYDHPFVLADRPHPAPVLAARVYDPGSGRVFELLTTEPAVQFYTGNGLPGTDRAANGKPMLPHGAFALESEHLPDSVHHPDWPTTELRPGGVYRSTTIWRFGTR